MGEPTVLFTELARALAQALDAWAATVGQATDTEKRPTRAGLIAELERDRKELERLGRTRKRIDEPLLAYWLKGRDQLRAGGKRNRLPGKEDSEAVARALTKREHHRAEQLPGISAEIADLARRLKDEGGTGWRDDVLASLVPEAIAGGDANPKSDTTSSAALPAPEESQQQRPRRGRPRRVRALGSALAVAVTATAVVTAVAVIGSEDDEGAESPSGFAAPRTPQPTFSNTPAQGGPAEAGASDSSGLEKGTLGEDSRCSAPFQGPHMITWRVCTRVEKDRVSFALKITNKGRVAADVKTRLEYARAAQLHPCPKAPNYQPLNIPAGQTVITDSRQCTVPREATPFAYQGVGRVVAKEANAGSYELSPAANVYPDRVIWRPDLV